MSSRRRTGAASEAEDGSAIVEFVFLGVLLLLPIIYLLVALGRIQAGALAVEQGAREAGRVFVTAPDESTAEARARAAATLAYQDQGFAPPGRDQLTIVCNASPCLSANGRVTVKGSITVVLPGIPRFLASLVPVQVTLSATHVAAVNKFAAR